MIIPEPHIINGKEFDNSFETYFRILKAYQLEDVLPESRINRIHSLLFGESGLSIEEKLKDINEYFNILKDGNTGQACNTEPVIDIIQDIKHIYSAFIQCYNIDLNKDRISIFKFNILLNDLTGTHLNEITELRAKPVPKPDKYNSEYRESLIKAKQAVALKPRNTRVSKDWKRSFIQGIMNLPSRRT